MPDEKTAEISKAGKMKEWAKKNARKLAAAGVIITGTTGGAVAGAAMEQLGPFAPSNVTETAQVRTELKFLDWYNLPADEQRKKADSMVGQEVTLYVNTSDLRLHTKMVLPDHVQVDLNMDLTRYPQFLGTNYDGHPVEMRLTKDQYEELKSKFERVTEATAGPGNSGIFPGDLIVPQDTIFKTKMDKLPRGDNPKEAYSEFVMQSHTSPTTAK